MNAIMVIVKNLPMEVKTLSKQDVIDICNTKISNATMTDCQKVTLENLPTIWQRYNFTLKRLKTSMTMEVAQYIVYYKNKIIIIQGQVGTINNTLTKKQLLERYKKFEPVFDYVANSLVIDDMYL